MSASDVSLRFRTFDLSPSVLESQHCDQSRPGATVLSALADFTGLRAFSFTGAASEKSYPRAHRFALTLTIRFSKMATV